MNIYKFDRYRQAFAALFEAQRSLQPGWSSAILATRIGVQPSHVSNVIGGRSHFSSDQIYAIGKELKLDANEVEYLETLKDWERADFPDRRALLLEKIHRRRDQELRAQKTLKAEPAKLSTESLEQYYLDPHVELIHLYLQTKAGRSQSTEEISQKWGLAQAHVADILRFLQKEKLISRKRDRWEVAPVHQMLATSSPLCRPQQILKRLRFLDSLQRLPQDVGYSFNATLTMTEDTRLFIQGRFVDFLKEIEGAVVASPADRIYHLQFDLSPWLLP